MNTNDWPEERTLRAILTLPGVSGQTLSDVEDYLGDARLIHEMHDREAAAMNESENPDDIYCEAHELRRRLCAAVNAHWGQLCDARAV